MTISLGICKGLTAKTVSRARRRLRGRKKTNGTVERSCMVVTRSARHLYIQVIDDTADRTLVSAPAMEVDLRVAEGDKSAKAHKVGEIIVRRAKEVGIENIVSDRAGNRHYGWIAALAGAAREAGLEF